MREIFKTLFLVIACMLTACNDSDSVDYVNAPSWIDAETPLNTLPDNANVGTNWALVFSDEFNDERIDFNKWTLRNSDPSTPRPALGLKGQSSNPENVLEKGGNLILKVSKVGEDMAEYGDVYSYKKFNTKYGYIEARMKVADTKKAVMTAFWMQTTKVNNVDGSGNDGAEIDIFESAYVNERSISTIHFDGYGTSHQTKSVHYTTPGLYNGYHVWGLLWNESTLKMYYDGELKAEFDGNWVPWVEEYIELSTGITFSNEGDFKNQPPNSLLSEAYVDYVRVWTLNNK